MMYKLFIVSVFFIGSLSLFSQEQVLEPEQKMIERIEVLKKTMQFQEMIHLIDSMECKIPYCFETKAEAQKSLGYVAQTKETIRAGLLAYPDSTALLERFAEIAQEIGDNRLAMQIANAITDKVPDPAWMIKKAEFAYAAEDYTQAIALSDSILQEVTVPSVVRLKARSLARLDSVAESIRVLETEYRRNPDDYMTMKQLANLCLAVDSVDKLVLITDAYLEKDSVNADILNLNAKGNYLSNHFQKAVERYTVLEQLGIEFDYDQNLFAGLAHYRANESYPLEAHQYLLKADSLSKGKFFEVKFYKAITAEVIGQTEKAYTYYNEAYQLIKPDTAQLVNVQNRLGRMAMMNGKPEKAVQHYLQSAGYDNDNEFTLISLALVYDYLEDEKQALTYYRHLLEVAPDTIHNPYSKRASERIRELDKKKSVRKK